MSSRETDFRVEAARLALEVMRDLISLEDMATELAVTRPTLMTWFKSPEKMPLKSYSLLMHYFGLRKGKIEKIMEVAELS